MQAFIIMQIGNSELDDFFNNILVPTLKKCNLNVKRVDEDNEGDLLKSEIDKFINSSDIILADLTNERPNCYLEVGYAMGLNKLQNLILTAREDHHHESPNYDKEGPKIHFDVSGYDIIFWDPYNLDEFKNKLEKKIKNRLNLNEKSKIDVLKSKYPQIYAKFEKTGLSDRKRGRAYPHFEIQYVNEGKVPSDRINTIILLGSDEKIDIECKVGSSTKIERLNLKDQDTKDFVQEYKYIKPLELSYPPSNGHIKEIYPHKTYFDHIFKCLDEDIPKIKAIFVLIFEKNGLTQQKFVTSNNEGEKIFDEIFREYKPY